MVCIVGRIWPLIHSAYSRCLVSFIVSVRAFFVLVWRCHLMLLFEAWWPKDDIYTVSLSKALYNWCFSFTAIGCQARQQAACQEQLGLDDLLKDTLTRPGLPSNRLPSDCQMTALSSWAIVALGLGGDQEPYGHSNRASDVLCRDGRPSGRFSHLNSTPSIRPLW